MSWSSSTARWARQRAWGSWAKDLGVSLYMFLENWSRIRISARAPSGVLRQSCSSFWVAILWRAWNLVAISWSRLGSFCHHSLGVSSLNQKFRMLFGCMVLVEVAFFAAVEHFSVFGGFFSV